LDDEQGNEIGVDYEAKEDSDRTNEMDERRGNAPDGQGREQA
jgi:hypothetical protein